MIRQIAKGMLTTLSINPNDSVLVIHRGEKRRSTAKRRHLRRQAKIRERLKNNVDADDECEETAGSPSEKYTNETLAMTAPIANWWGDITGGIFLGEHAHLYDMWKVRRICVP